MIRKLALIFLLILAFPTVSHAVYGSCDDLIIGTSSSGGGSSCTPTSCGDTNCPCDKTALFTCVWEFDSDLTGDSGTIGGSSCDLTGNNSPTYSTGTKLSGSHALDIGAENQSASCSACDTTGLLNPAATQDFTYFCFFYPDDDAGTTNREIVDGSDSTNSGYSLYRNKSNDDARAEFRSGSSWKTADGTNSGYTINSWYFTAHVMDNVGSTNYVGYLNVDGVDDANTGASAAYTRDSNPDFYIGSAAGSSALGFYDLCGLIQQALSQDELCYMCACGPANQYSCKCDDSDATAFQDINGGGTPGLGANGRNSSCNNCLDGVTIDCNSDVVDTR